ncbi:pre-mRNA 3'-end-processing factor FIP1-like isoform X3 [Oncorhynchus keta]|uniref:pre-mRNA 3'-end-processing factor FIP1-like isoform X3 n=1 Tax=Oncorhynchus keta TaxID=8018 RepID=UPI00227CFA0A|nr:pre-mRNA 3'-end-processing factor FIP1-like isoform X3 [Oncorhynchus keta]
MCCENLEFGEITGISLRFILFAGVTVKLCDSEEVTEFGETCPQKKMTKLLMQAGAMKRNNCYMEDTGQEDQESDSDNEDDDDDDMCVTIGAPSRPFSAFGSTPVNLIIKVAGRTHASGNKWKTKEPLKEEVTVCPKAKGVDVDAQGSVNGIPVLEVDVESFEEKPWRKHDSHFLDYFNYGFNEDSWKAYCENQRRLRMGYKVMNHASATKLMIQEWDLPCFRSDYSTPSNHYKSALSSRKTSGTTNVIGGQTGTISWVEEQRRHNIEGNNIQVLSKPSDAEPTPTKMPPFFPPPPFPPPPYNVNSAPPLIPPPRYPPGAPPPSLISTLDMTSALGPCLRTTWHDDSLLSPVLLAVLLLQFQLFCLRLWNPDLFTGRATCPRPAVFNSLETAGAVEILLMISYEKPTDIYS